MQHAAKRNTLLVATALLLLAGRLSAQALPAPPETVEDALHGVANEAALIFTGSVTAVTALDNAAEVTFQVEEGVRGASSGGTLRIRVSRWGGGVERFHTGERALFLLHAPSLAGFTSPVHGDSGIVPLSGDRLAGALDLRWIATGVRRSVSVRLERAASVSAQSAPAQAFTRATQTTTISGAAAASQLAMSNVTGEDVHAMDRDLVTGMLRTWSLRDSAKGTAR